MVLKKALLFGSRLKHIEACFQEGKTVCRCSPEHNYACKLDYIYDVQKTQLPLQIV